MSPTWILLPESATRKAQKPEDKSLRCLLLDPGNGATDAIEKPRMMKDPQADRNAREHQDHPQMKGNAGTYRIEVLPFIDVEFADQRTPIESSGADFRRHAAMSLFLRRPSSFGRYLSHPLLAAEFSFRKFRRIAKRFPNFDKSATLFSVELLRRGVVVGKGVIGDEHDFGYAVGHGRPETTNYRPFAATQDAELLPADNEPATTAGSQEGINSDSTETVHETTSSNTNNHPEEDPPENQPKPDVPNDDANHPDDTESPRPHSETSVHSPPPSEEQVISEPVVITIPDDEGAKPGDEGNKPGDQEDKPGDEEDKSGDDEDKRGETVSKLMRCRDDAKNWPSACEFFNHDPSVISHKPEEGVVTTGAKQTLLPFQATDVYLILLLVTCKEKDLRRFGALLAHEMGERNRGKGYGLFEPSFKMVFGGEEVTFNGMVITTWEKEKAKFDLSPEMELGLAEWEIDEEKEPDILLKRAGNTLTAVPPDPVAGRLPASLFMVVSRTMTQTKARWENHWARILTVHTYDNEWRTVTVRGSMCWGLVVADEVHEYRSLDSGQAKSLLGKISRQSKKPWVLSLSGTPVLDSISNLAFPFALMMGLPSLQQAENFRRDLKRLDKAAMAVYSDTEAYPVSDQRSSGFSGQKNMLILTELPFGATAMKYYVEECMDPTKYRESDGTFKTYTKILVSTYELCFNGLDGLKVANWEVQYAAIRNHNKLKQAAARIDRLGQQITPHVLRFQSTDHPLDALVVGDLDENNKKYDSEGFLSQITNWEY
ncbi:hypothetical protein CCHR01_19526 [Colletotrichum chrysophilum]|uniref:Uncharacterized protein n=1 Tax=Colletotrichum chrysophilum TaxID=1836956 RepID=A0AAD8ZZI7_9PEZI|nr:hypothetical protein CCHR01_19526 [Colletotrichum chrysophilum]